jgi:hypothetical protein
MAPIKKPNLTKERNAELISDLLDTSFLEGDSRRLVPGAAKAAASKFEISRRQVLRLWATARERRLEEGRYTASPRKKGRSGRPRVYDRDAMTQAVESIPREDRSTIRDLSGALGVSVGQAHHWIRNERIIFPHSSPVLPYLTEPAKLIRLMYAAERIEAMEDGTYKYKGAFDEIHVDEKWFFITPITQRLYLSEREARESLPKRRVKHKSHILKVMFLAAVARPRFNDAGECVFDGKLGFWPVVAQVQAQRNSVNRPAGTWETKSVNMTKEVYTDFICNKLIPNVLAKFPRDRSVREQTIAIQQDNPPTHMGRNDPTWLEAANRDARFKFVLREQPAQSPDTNILDLGLFAALQTSSWKLKRAGTIDGLIANCQTTWDRYDPASLARIWSTHQAVCDEILKAGGDNDYRLPHLAKGASERQHNWKFPCQINVSAEALESAELVRQI